MRPLHKMVIKGDTRNYSKYVQVKDGRGYASNGHSFVSLPVEEVLQDAWREGEELFFEISCWEKPNLHKAVTVARQNDTFFSLDKKGAVIGSIEAVKRNDLTFYYPDFNLLLDRLPEKTSLFNVAFSADLLSRIAAVFKCEQSRLQLHFHRNSILISPYRSDGYAYLLGLNPDPHDFTPEWVNKGELR